MFYEKDYKDKLASMHQDVLIRYEVPFEGVRADAVAFTDPVTAFEIKSEKDTLDRLQNQVSKYFRVLPRVVVMVHESKVPDTVRLLGDTSAGIWSMNDKKDVKICVEGKTDDSHISHAAIYNILCKPEREVILRRHFGYLPPIGDFEYFRNRLEYFKNIPKQDILTECREALMKRYINAGNKVNTSGLDGDTVALILKYTMENEQ